MNIHGMLEANGIAAVLVGPPRASLEEANRLLQEAREAGPEAADEAEGASEGTV